MIVIQSYYYYKVTNANCISETENSVHIVLFHRIKFWGLSSTFVVLFSLTCKIIAVVSLGISGKIFLASDTNPAAGKGVICMAS